MKKMNKKGFTLAELLIVIAIIAVLIAIAIPTFSGALENAKRQTDHANIRAAYSLCQVAKLEGGVRIGTSTELTTAEGTYYFNKDGSLSAADDKSKAYITQVAGDTTSCGACAGCNGTVHSEGKCIGIKIAGGSITLVLTDDKPTTTSAS